MTTDARMPGMNDRKGSKWSVGSENSILSIGSKGAILSIGSVGSILFSMPHSPEPMAAASAI